MILNRQILSLSLTTLLVVISTIQAQHYNDDTTPHQIHLEDLENEHDEKSDQLPEIQQQHQQQPPSFDNTDERLPSNINKNHKSVIETQTRRTSPSVVFVPQSVIPLQQAITSPSRPKFPLHPNYDIVAAAANRYSFGINPSSYPDSEREIIEGNAINPNERDIDDDIVSYSHDISPLALKQAQQIQQQQQQQDFQQQQQFEFQQPHRFGSLSSGGGGAGYTLLVPPFGEDEISDEHSQRQLQQRPQQQQPHLQPDFYHPLQQQLQPQQQLQQQQPHSYQLTHLGPTTFNHQRRPIVPYESEEGITQLQRPPSRLPSGLTHRFSSAPTGPATHYPSPNAGGIQYLTSNDLPEAPAGTIEYSAGYFNGDNSERPVIQYGSPNVGFRRPSNFRPQQSNQFAYAPIRSDGGKLSPGSGIPFPPSFISITTRRPELGFYSGPPSGVRPLGRSLYRDDFRPSAVDPVPDFFSNRQSKSLLDSYIPSWVVHRMLHQYNPQHYPGFNNNNFAQFSPYSRFLRRSSDNKSVAQDRKDADVVDDQKTVIKKSLDTQMATSDADEMLMTA